MDDLNLTPAPDYSNPGFDNTPVPTEEPVLPQHPALAHLAVDEPAAEPIPEAVTEPVTVTEPVEVEPPVEVAPVETAPALAHAPGEIPEHGSTSSPTVRNDGAGVRNDDRNAQRNDAEVRYARAAEDAPALASAPGQSQKHTTSLPLLEHKSVMVWAILTTVFCCMFGGLIAIFLSAKSNQLYTQAFYETEPARRYYLYQQSEAKNRQAKVWIWLNVIIGGIAIFALFMAALKDL